MVTLSDIAKEAGVNITTVSKALNGSEDLNRANAASIRALAVRMGYVKKKRKTVSTPDSGTVGIICPDFRSLYCSALAQLLEHRLTSKGYECVYATSCFDEKKELHLLERFVERKCSGIIFMSSTEFRSVSLKDFASCHSVPVVQVSPSYINGDHDIICVDERIGFEYALEHLTSLGHKKIGVLSAKHGKQRIANFKSVLGKLKIPCCDDYIKIGTPNREQCGYTLMSEMLEQDDRPTAIIALNVEIALGAMRRINETSLSVPEDLSVIGFCDADFVRYLHVPLSTVSCHASDICSAAADVVIRRMQNPAGCLSQSILVKPDFVIRNSTAQVRN